MFTMEKLKVRFVLSVLLTVFLFAMYGCTDDKDEIQVVGISVEPTAITLIEGETAQLAVTITPENATSGVQVTSSDANVATVDGEYVVTALKEGETVITFGAGAVSATCSVTVLTRNFGVYPALNEIVFDAANPDPIEFRVTGDKQWEVESDADWCTVTQTESGFQVVAAQNASMTERAAATLTVTPQSDDAPIQMAVKQNGLKIYLGGDDNNRATYWMNGEMVRVMDDPEVFSTLSNIYATQKGNVSVVGRVGNSQPIGFYWDQVNGLYLLNSGEDRYGAAFSVFVDEVTGDIYFTDHEGWMVSPNETTYVARYWKNFVPTNLTEEGLVSHAGDIICKDGNLYIMVQEGGDNYYLKNGEKVMLETGFSEEIFPAAMCIVGDDVYIGGYYDAGTVFSPCYWKNGKITILASDESAQPYGIAVDDQGNVYLAGSYGSGLVRAAAYWKNDDMTLLTGQTNCCLSGIAVVDGNIICGGTNTTSDGVSYASYWINGEETRMSDGTTNCWVEAMFVR